jgi:transcription elongation factor GreB
VSKAFTSEETEDAPVLVRPRAPLPPGVTNYVTPSGLAALGEELRQLQDDRSRLESKGDERKRDLQMANGRMAELEARLASATPVDPQAQPQDEVRFGATVVVEGESGAPRTYQIVGVDEADVKQGKIAFVAPLARALLGRKVGEAVTVATPRNDEELTVKSIAYW